MPERNPFGKLARGFAVASVLGMGFAAAVGAGVWAGLWIDRRLGWRPIGFTLALGLLGGAAGVVFVIRTIAALDRGERGEGSGKASRRNGSEP